MVVKQCQSDRKSSISASKMFHNKKKDLARQLTDSGLTKRTGRGWDGGQESRGLY